jgi:hypothetical protein
MKKIYFFTFIILSIFINAQRSFVPVEITKSDGTTENVLLRDIYFPNTNSYMGIIKQSKNKSIFEKEQKFEYKTSENSSIQKISYNDIQKIKVLDRNDDLILGFEKLNIKEVNRNGILSDKNYDAILPILYEGKMNIYGYNYLICSKNNIISECRYFTTVIYVKNNKSDFAVMPVDIDKISGFNSGGMDDKFIQAFKYAGSDCAEFLKYINDLDKQLKTSDFKKKIKQDFKDYYRNNSGNPNDIMAKYTLDFYKGIVSEYEKNCE